MSKKIKLLLILALLLPIIVGGAYTGYNILAETPNSDAGGTNNDTWALGGNFTYQNPDLASATYNSIVATLSGEINTTLFGDFTFSSLDFIKTSGTTCNGGDFYSLSGTINSVEAWGDMSFTGSSYYCPYDNSFSGTLYSDWLGYKQIGNTTDTGTGYIGASFNVEESLLVQGLIGTSNTVNNTGAIVNTEHGNTQTSQVLQISANKAKLTESINKNIAILTRHITPINNLTPSNYPSGVDPVGNIINNLSYTDELYYFNYEGAEETDISNEDNKGKILEISNSTWDSSNFENYQVGVKGHKTVIIKGGNVYIDADIYNVDNDSLLVLVVKRDSTNRQNGGNVYIDPKVTNIDAVIIAEGSIINFDGTDVLTDSNDLRNQLYIYGSAFTKNSIGSTTSPYGSDSYIKYGDVDETGAAKYDLTKLRYFNLIISNDTMSTCSSPDNSLVPRVDSSMDAKEYAWAGKRKCFNEPSLGFQDSVQNNLRGSELFNPLIIEYNPLIQKNPPYILQKH